MWEKFRTFIQNFLHSESLHVDEESDDKNIKIS